MTGAFTLPSLLRILEMPTKPDTPRATTATRAGFVRCGLGTTFSRRGSIPTAEDDQSPSNLQLNTQGFTANKISVIKQLAVD